MSEPIDRYLKYVISAPKSSERAKELAVIMLDRWDQGIIPSGSQLLELEKLTAPADSCSRLEHDGACAWLRKYGAVYKLAVPPMGQRAMCCYTTSFTSCPGYRKPK